VRAIKAEAMVGGTGRTPKGLSDHLGAHGSGLRTTGQAKFRADVPETELAPPPTKGCMAIVLVADIAAKPKHLPICQSPCFLLHWSCTPGRSASGIVACSSAPEDVLK
jgi:hypothetical protein